MIRGPLSHQIKMIREIPGALFVLGEFGDFRLGQGIYFGSIFAVIEEKPGGVEEEERKRYDKEKQKKKEKRKTKKGRRLT